jgi:hypothetical protein
MVTRLAAVAAVAPIAAPSTAPSALPLPSPLASFFACGTGLAVLLVLYQLSELFEITLRDGCNEADCASNSAGHGALMPCVKQTVTALFGFLQRCPHLGFRSPFQLRARRNASGNRRTCR